MVQHTETRKSGGPAETLWSSLYRIDYFDCDSFDKTNILNTPEDWGTARLTTTPIDKD